MKPVLLLLALAGLSHGRILTFTWELPDSPVDGHIVYFKRAGSEQWVEVGATEGITFSGDFPDGHFEVGVTAYRGIQAGDWIESEMAVLAIPERPEPPKGLRVRI